mmetsp:Transcript_45498/g.97509  ORF Transcript_45498/g.97509 Transcript_45498/m.97509 type:complete len:275 (+) Transcript_45498:697-1521(+)
MAGDVVGDNDSWHFGICFVQGSDRPEVFDRFGELPVAIQGSLIKLREADTAGALVLLLHKHILHLAALVVLERSKLVADLLDERRGLGEGGANLLGSRKWVRWLVEVVLGTTQVVGPEGHVRPGRVGAVSVLEDGLDLPPLQCGNFRTQDDAEKVRFDGEGGVLLVQRRVHGEVEERVGLHQEVGALLVHELLDSSRKCGQIFQIKASTMHSLFEDALEEGGHAILHDFDGRATVELAVVGLETFHEPAAGLNEVAMECIADHGRVKPSIPILR